jgi:hypothetical protein
VVALGQVVANVAEDVLQLAAKEDHGHDHGNSDDGNDEGVLDKTLALFLTKERDHSEVLLPCMLGALTDGRRHGKVWRVACRLSNPPKVLPEQADTGLLFV